METVKDIAAILGVILSAASVLALVNKNARALVNRIFLKRKEPEEIREAIDEIKKLIEEHIKQDEGFRTEIVEMNNISLEFARTQCRNIIKNIFYRYKADKKLPLYEKKTLVSIRKLYIEKLKGNSFALLLLDEMSDWETDYEDSHAAEHADD